MLVNDMEKQSKEYNYVINNIKGFNELYGAATTLITLFLP